MSSRSQLQMQSEQHTVLAAEQTRRAHVIKIPSVFRSEYQHAGHLQKVEKKTKGTTRKVSRSHSAMNIAPTPLILKLRAASAQSSTFWQQAAIEITHRAHSLVCNKRVAAISFRVTL